MVTEARITARIIVLLVDVMNTVHEEAGDIVESAHPMMIAEEVIPHAIVQGAVLVLPNIVGAVALVLQAMQGIEIIAPLVVRSTVLVAQGKSALVLFYHVHAGQVFSIRLDDLTALFDLSLSLFDRLCKSYVLTMFQSLLFHLHKL